MSCGCHCRRQEVAVVHCPPPILHVNCVENFHCECEGPVILRTAERIGHMGLDRCFKLVLCRHTLTFINTKPTWLCDGEVKYPLVKGGTGNVVHYDQLVELVNNGYRMRRGFGYGYGGYGRGAYGYGYGRDECCGKREIVLDCFLGADGAYENGIHIEVNSWLPPTTFIPRPDLRGLPEGDGYEG